MRFEFKMVPGKPVAKEPPQHPNPFELLKTGEKQKEIIRGEPVTTDAFGRTLYQTPNGQFRAIGDTFNLVANVFQAQNNFVTLAPPPDDDEEDTMPKGKSKRKAGGIIITPPVTAKWFEICFVVDTYKGERIYRFKAGETLEKCIFEEIFNCPPNYEPYGWWTEYLAFGFLNKGIFVRGYDKDWDGNNTFFLIGGNQAITKTAIVEDSQLFNEAKFSYYDNKVYLAYFDEAGNIKIKHLTENLEIIDVDEISVSGHNYTENLYIWKNFVVFQRGFYLNIYDYINKKFIAQIKGKEKSEFRFLHIVQDIDTYACFVWGPHVVYRAETQEQHFFIINENGEYLDIVVNGSSGWMDATKDKVYVAYQQYKNPAFSDNLLFAEKWNNEFIVVDNTAGYRLWNKVPLQTGEAFDNIFRFNLVPDVTLKAEWIGRVAEGKYLIKSGSKLYHLGEDLSNPIEICDLSEVITETNFSLRMYTVPELDGTVFIFLDLDYYKRYTIYRSLDNGKNWSRVLDNAASGGGLSSNLICCGNGCIWVETDDAMYARYSNDNGSTWPLIGSGTDYERYVEAIGRGLPVQKIGQPWLWYWGWNVDFLPIHYLKETGLAYFRYGPYTDYTTDPYTNYPAGTRISSDHGYSFHDWENPPPGGIIMKMLATEDGNLVLAYIASEGEYKLYSCSNNGTWIDMGIPFYPLGLYEIPEGLVLVTKYAFYLSTNDGVTWKSISTKSLNISLVEIYSTSGTLIKRKTWKDHELSKIQQRIGLGTICKFYNRHFYFDDGLYNIDIDEIQKNAGFGSPNRLLWLGDYVLYNISNPGGGGNIFLMKDMRTGEIRTLMENEIIKYGEPYFFPEHMMNYYLKLST